MEGMDAQREEKIATTMSARMISYRLFRCKASSLFSCGSPFPILLRSHKFVDASFQKFSNRQTLVVLQL